jgi:PKHD-type hydroxylase
MLLRLPSVLTSDQLHGTRDLLARAQFVDGKLSAGMAAARVKHNQEADRRAGDIQQIDNLVMGALVQHPLYRSGALPLRVAAPFYARYTPGMRYGDHVDDPIMGTEGMLYRTDVAITIFLNDPENYDGGELTVRTAIGENRVKLPAGDGVMYPASSLHHVAEVTRGERLVAVTWVQSLVRDPTQRELLYELNLAREKLLKTAPAADETAKVNTAYVNLVRMWSDF